MAAMAFTPSSACMVDLPAPAVVGITRERLADGPLRAALRANVPKGTVIRSDAERAESLQQSLADCVGSALDELHARRAGAAGTHAHWRVRRTQGRGDDACTGQLALSGRKPKLPGQ